MSGDTAVKWGPILRVYTSRDIQERDTLLLLSATVTLLHFKIHVKPHNLIFYEIFFLKLWNIINFGVCGTTPIAAKDVIIKIYVKQQSGMLVA